MKVQRKVEKVKNVLGRRFRNLFAPVRDIKATNGFYLCVTCKEVRLICSEDLKQGFEGLFRPEIVSNQFSTSSLNWGYSCDSSPG